ncbi:hypothetical protein CHUAL_011824 [Chamberlinius hualienensis]
MATDNHKTSKNVVPKNFSDVATMLGLLKWDVAILRSDSHNSSNDMKTKMEDMIRFMEQMELRFDRMVTRCEQSLQTVVDDVKQHERERREINQANKDWINQFRQPSSSSQNNCQIAIGNISVTLPIQHNEAYIWTIHDIGQKLQQTTFECKTEVFPLPGYNFGAQAKLYCTDENRVLMWIAFVDSKNTREPLYLKVFPKVTFMVCDLSGQKISRDAVRTCDCDFKESIRYDQFYYGVYLPDKSKLLYPTYNFYDSIKIKIFVDPPNLTKTVASTDGQINWTIDNYQLKKQLEIEEQIVWQESQYFYTSPEGYRVQILLRLNGYHKSNKIGLTAYVWFLTGEFDEHLTKSFAHKTTITVINQQSTELNIVKSVEKRAIEKKGYYLELESQEYIENSNFIVDDKLELNIVITPTN